MNDRIDALHSFVKVIRSVESSDDDEGELLFELRKSFPEICFLLGSSDRSSNVESLRQSFVGHC